MKYLITVILVAFFLLSFSIDSSYAQKCNSAARVVGDIWTKTHSVAVALECAALTGMTAVMSTVTPIPTFDYSTCFNTMPNSLDLTAQLVQYWNDNVGNGWATIGPRRLEFNKDMNGTLVSTGGRMFVSFPIVNANSIKITIDETGGKGKTSVVVCKADPGNQYTKVDTKWFNDTSQRKKKKNEHREVTVNGAKNHIIVVHLDGKSVGNTFKYKLRATSN